MAFKMNTNAQLTFFNSVFGPKHPVTTKVGILLGAGFTFETSLYDVTAKPKAASAIKSQVKLTVGTTALMKGTVDTAVADQNKKLIGTWIENLYLELVPAQSWSLGPEQKIGESSVVTVILDGASNVEVTNKIAMIKAVMNVTAKSLKESKDLVEAALAGAPQALLTFDSVDAAKGAIQVLESAGAKATTIMGGVVPTFKQDVEKALFEGKFEHQTSVTESIQNLTESFKKLGNNFEKVKPVKHVIHLKDAQALGQKVFGTSPGSIYYTIALSEHVKVAARVVQGGTISIRTEWTDNPVAELKKLSDAGVQMKSGYGSIHFASADVPVQRTIGAFLVGAGINWKAAVMNGADLVVGGQS